MNNINTFLRLKAEMKKQIPLTRVSMVLYEDNAHEAEEFKKYWVDKVDYVALQRFVPISLFEEDDSDEMAHTKRETPMEGKQKCSYAFESVFIHGDGLVLPCAAHKARKIAIGNIHNDSIYDILHSEAMENIRNCHKKGDISSLKLCPACFK